MNLILIAVSVMLCLVAFLGMSLMQMRNKKANLSDEQNKQRSILTAQEMVNVKDINDIFLYTKDNFIITYIKVQPISVELLTDEELRNLAVNLTEEFSRERRAFKFLAISKPVDIAPLVNEYSELLTDSHDQIQKKLLRSEIRVITDFTLSGEVVEREFYYILWEKSRDGAEIELRKRTKELEKNINSTGIGAVVMKKHEIVKLCNLVNNPTLTAIETQETDATIPFIELYGGGRDEETSD